MTKYLQATSHGQGPYSTCDPHTPSVTITLKSIDFGLITNHHPIPIMDSPILLMLSNFQLATHILALSNNLFCFSNDSRPDFMKCMLRCVGAHYHTQVPIESFHHLYNIV